MIELCTAHKRITTEIDGLITRLFFSYFENTSKEIFHEVKVLTKYQVLTRDTVCTVDVSSPRPNSLIVLVVVREQEYVPG